MKLVTALSKFIYFFNLKAGRAKLKEVFKTEGFVNKIRAAFPLAYQNNHPAMFRLYREHPKASETVNYTPHDSTIVTRKRKRAKKESDRILLLFLVFLSIKTLIPLQT